MVSEEQNWYKQIYSMRKQPLGFVVNDVEKLIPQVWATYVYHFSAMPLSYRALHLPLYAKGLWQKKNFYSYESLNELLRFKKKYSKHVIKQP